jgi:ferrochelatase
MPKYTAAAQGVPRERRTAVLLVQLGTPDAPEPAAVRRYLREFLSDPRVVEIPSFVWKPILYGVILPLRPRESAKKYASIWTAEGSPLALNTRRQAAMLRGWLGERGAGVDVDWAMRYGNPGMPQVLREIRERGADRLLVIPMYPQYAASTTASVCDALWAELATWRNLPQVRVVRDFHDFAPYVDALAANVRARWTRDGPPERLVMSFHGIPKRSIDLGDPYRDECLATGRLLAARLGLAEDRYLITFQSRFGRAEWLQPYTAPTLAELGRAGCGRVDVMCPGFVSDCLETLEEISIEARHTFLEAGGGEFRYLPCLNDDPGFVGALADLAQRHLAGWAA